MTLDLLSLGLATIYSFGFSSIIVNLEVEVPTSSPPVSAEQPSLSSKPSTIHRGGDHQKGLAITSQGDPRRTYAEVLHGRRRYRWETQGVTDDEIAHLQQRFTKAIVFMDDEIDNVTRSGPTP